MRKLATFNRTLWQSILSFSYYNDVVKAPFVFSLKFFLMFSAMIGLVATISLGLALYPPALEFAKRFETRAQGLYPRDLVITIQKGKLHTNVAEPLRFPVPFELFMEMPGTLTDQKQKYLLTIDTKAEASDYDNSQSVILITSDTLVIPDSGGGHQLFPLSEMGDIVIDKKLATENLSKIMPFIRMLPYLLIAVLCSVFFIFLPLSWLISLLFFSVLLLFAARLMQLNLSYRKIYQIGLHSLALPTLIQITLTSMGIIPPIPFFNSLVFLLYSLVILAELRKNPRLHLPSKL